MELCLGTVQFGMDYGVFNQHKKDMDYCIKCLDYATQNGIRAIDTATAYGNAEEVVGQFLKEKTVDRTNLFLSTKLLPNVLDDIKPSDYEEIITKNLQESLKILHTDYVDTYYFHSSRYILDSEMIEALQIVKEKGLAKAVGVSIYYEDEAAAALNNPMVEYVQAPYSVFDHRMKNVGLFDEKKMGELKIDTRTTFIKGLIRLSEDEVPKYLAKSKPILRKLDKICKETGYTRVELAIGYVKREKAINHLVFGIRNMEQLKMDIAAFDKEIPMDVLCRLDDEFKNIDTDIVIPSLWKR